MYSADLHKIYNNNKKDRRAQMLSMRWRSADIHTSIGEFLVVRVQKKKPSSSEVLSMRWRKSSWQARSRQNLYFSTKKKKARKLGIHLAFRP